MFTNRLSLADDANVFDNALKPMVWHNGKLVSAEYKMQVGLCQGALAGNRACITAILRYAQGQADAQPRFRDYDFTGERRYNPRERRATTAMLLLAIASRAAAGEPVRLEPWVRDLALRQEGAAVFGDHDIDLLNDHVRDRASPEPADFHLPLVVTPARPGSAATQFVKGKKSPNPKGRPKKHKPVLPYSGYFEEVCEVHVPGKKKKRRVTRLQYVLHLLDIKALKGDPGLIAFLASKQMQQQLKEHMQLTKRNKFSGVPPWGDEYDEDCIAGNPFEQMLRKFRITNRRTKTRVLLEPWVVEGALARFGERQLTLAEQGEVLRSTSKPASVAWPEWWEIRNHDAAKPHLAVKPRARRKKKPPYNYKGYYDYTDKIDLIG
jgi:hypothetical protein